MEACTVFIEHVPKITDMRRYLVMHDSRFPPELARVFRNLETKGNPWDFRPNQRADWAEGLEVPELAAVAAQAESEGRPLFAELAVKPAVERAVVAHGGPASTVEAVADSQGGPVGQPPPAVPHL